jgi:hypothetical protein
VQVVDGEGGERDPSAASAALKGLAAGRVSGWSAGSVPLGVVGRDDRQRRLLAEGELGVRLEPSTWVSKWCVFVLVVCEDTGQVMCRRPP